MGTFVTAMYHEICDTDRLSLYTLRWSDFRAQLQALVEMNVSAGGFSHLEESVRLKQEPPPVILTFDDGHISNLEAAHEIAGLGMRCTVFVNPKFCMERTDFMKPQDLRALQKVADVGAHGFTHAPLTKMGDAALRAELVDSKRWIEDIIGSDVRYMSVPGGYVDGRVLSACHAAGFALIGNSVEWWNRASPERMPDSVNRIALRRDWPLDTFQAVVRRRPGFYLRRRLRGAAMAIPKAVLSDAMTARINRLRRG